jgi:hypothetical protein
MENQEFQVEVDCLACQQVLNITRGKERFLRRSQDSRLCGDEQGVCKERKMVLPLFRPKPGEHLPKGNVIYIRVENSD